MSQLTGRPMRALFLSAIALAGAAIALLLAAGAQASAPPECTTAQLVTTIGDGNGAAGTIYYTLNFTNLGRTCTLRGYPGVSAVNLRGQQLGSPAARASGNRERTITLRAPQDDSRLSSATTTLGIVDAAVFSAPGCDRGLAAGLRIYPPDQRAAEAVPLPFAACTRAGVSFLNVRAVR